MENFNPLYVIAPMFVFMGYLMLRVRTKVVKKTKQWEYTSTGVVTDKVEYSNSKNNAIKPTVRYEIDGERHEFTSSIGQNPRLRPGKKVGVFYNPDNPEEGIIDTFVQRGSIFRILGMIFMGVGFFLLYILVKLFLA